MSAFSDWLIIFGSSTPGQVCIVLLVIAAFLGVAYWQHRRAANAEGRAMNWTPIVQLGIAILSLIALMFCAALVNSYLAPPPSEIIEIDVVCAEPGAESNPACEGVTILDEESKTSEPRAKLDALFIYGLVLVLFVLFNLTRIRDVVGKLFSNKTPERAERSEEPTPPVSDEPHVHARAKEFGVELLSAALVVPPRTGQSLPVEEIEYNVVFTLPGIRQTRVPFFIIASSDSMEARLRGELDGEFVNTILGETEGVQIRARARDQSTLRALSARGRLWGALREIAHVTDEFGTDGARFHVQLGYLKMLQEGQLEVFERLFPHLRVVQEELNQLEEGNVS